jgi:ribosomal protein L20
MFEDRRISISCTLKPIYIEKLDKKAKERGITRSRFIENLVVAALEGENDIR